MRQEHDGIVEEEHVKQNNGKPISSRAMSEEGKETSAMTYGVGEVKEKQGGDNLYKELLFQHLGVVGYIPCDGLVCDKAADEEEHRHTEGYEHAANDGLGIGYSKT